MNLKGLSSTILTCAHSRIKIDSVNGLLVEIGEGELATEDDDWKLSTKKRNTLLAVMSGEVTEAAVEPSENAGNRKHSAAKNSALLWNLTKVAVANRNRWHWRQLDDGHKRS